MTTGDVKFGIQIGSDWPQKGQIWNFLRSVLRSASQYVLKLIRKNTKIVPFGANLTQFCLHIWHIPGDRSENTRLSCDHVYWEYHRGVTWPCLQGVPPRPDVADNLHKQLPITAPNTTGIIEMCYLICKSKHTFFSDLLWCCHDWIIIILVVGYTWWYGRINFNVVNKKGSEAKTAIRQIWKLTGFYLFF